MVNYAGHNRDWLLSVRRLVEAGEARSHGHRIRPKLCIATSMHNKSVSFAALRSDYPSIDWDALKPIKAMLSKFFKGQVSAANKAMTDSSDWKSCETCSLEELHQVLWQDEACRTTAAECEEKNPKICDSEVRAQELLCKDMVTYDEVWQIVSELEIRTLWPKTLESKSLSPKLCIPILARLGFTVRSR